MLINLPENELFLIKHRRDEHPRQSDFEMHAHGHFELLFFLSGDITYLVEGRSYRPQAEDLLLFNIAETHMVKIESDRPYERAVIQMDRRLLSALDPELRLFSSFRERALGENNILHAAAFPDGMWKECLSRLLVGCDQPATCALLATLLNEIRHAMKPSFVRKEEPSFAAQLVQYVNDRIAEPISPAEIAQHFFIGRTTLYKRFREATGSGIHDYINVKRLIMAQELLNRGEAPTKIYERCGFRDYTTFFRAYKAHFAVSPSEAMKHR